MDRVLNAGGRIVIADLMFENESARSDFEAGCSARQREELEDEFFTTIQDMKHIFNKLGYQCVFRQIDELIWVICADKGDRS